MVAGRFQEVLTLLFVVHVVPSDSLNEDYSLLCEVMHNIHDTSLLLCTGETLIPVTCFRSRLREGLLVTSEET